MRYAFAAVLLLFAAPLFADPPLPPSFNAAYAVYKGPLQIGTARRSFAIQANGHFVYTSESRTSGLVALLVREVIREESVFTATDGELKPVQYRYRRDGMKKRSVHQTFDWQGSQVKSEVDGTVHTLPLPKGAVDQNMYQLRIMVDLKRGLRTMDYAMVLNDKIKDIPIRQLGTETIDTPFGKFATVVIQRQEKRSATTMWCAEALHFLPVRIDHNEDGSEFSAQLVGLEGMK